MDVRCGSNMSILQEAILLQLPLELLLINDYNSNQINDQIW